MDGPLTVDGEPITVLLERRITWLVAKAFEFALRRGQDFPVADIRCVSKRANFAMSSQCTELAESNNIPGEIVSISTYIDISHLYIDVSHLYIDVSHLTFSRKK